MSDYYFHVPPFGLISAFKCLLLCVGVVGLVSLLDLIIFHVCDLGFSFVSVY